MSQKFVCATCLISGSVPPVRRTNGASAYARVQRVGHLRLGRARRQRDVDRLEDAAVERHEMRHERHRRVRAPARSPRCAGARRCRTRRRCRGSRRSACGRVGALPAPEMPDFASTTTGPVEQAGRGQRLEREQRRRGIAAGIRDQPRLADRVLRAAPASRRPCRRAAPPSPDTSAGGRRRRGCGTRRTGR